ncbi:hypothetical protein BHOIPH791_11700 [Bartonella henselae]|nr:hypothetical protein Q654_01123 [Bartonella henselae JK 50]ETS08799.1 hypothetical protein Q655_01076 [Bartonella henselae JK 51]CDO40475.1 phage related protein [Bartonella henselae]CUH91049.1 phage related protein [Bartonella henselae]GFF01754.1 hypothetical protein BH623125_01880 [Bartonella henselae]
MVYRMRVLRDFVSFKKSDFDDFRDQGNCWLECDIRSRYFIEDRCVFRDPKFYNDSYICDRIYIYDNGQIYCMSFVSSVTVGYGKAQAYGPIEICRSAYVSNKIKIILHSKGSGNAYIYGDAKVYDYVCITNSFEVYCKARIYNIQVYDSAQFFANSQIYNNALVCGYVKIRKKTKIYCNAEVGNCEDLRNDEETYIFFCILHGAKEANTNNGSKACVEYLPP